MGPAPLPTTGGIVTFAAFEQLFTNIVVVAVGFAGIVCFIMLVMGGISYLTAGGEPQKVEAAKKTLTYAIFGLIVIVMSFIVIRFISIFTGVGKEILNFQIKQ